MVGTTPLARRVPAKSSVFVLHHRTSYCILPREDHKMQVLCSRAGTGRSGEVCPLQATRVRRQ